MVVLCKYKNVLGVPKQGFHESRIPVVDLAFNDVVGTIGLGLILWGILCLFKINTNLSKNLGLQCLYSILIMFGIGIFLHWLFCVDTTLNIFLFGKNENS